GLVQKPRAWATRRDNSLYLHFPNGPEAEGFALYPLQALPRRATLLNDGSKLETSLAFMPTLYQSGPRFVHLRGLPVETLLDEPIVVRMDLDPATWASLEAARGAAGGKEVL
ncbi:MAG TPA: hypothetical protein PKE04_08040, partial [Clostridia bacterium]|nr:hypothetical protein [Clostridia bacterium]